MFRVVRMVVTVKKIMPMIMYMGKSAILHARMVMAVTMLILFMIIVR
jgi:hypothetical protein